MSRGGHLEPMLKRRITPPLSLSCAKFRSMHSIASCLLSHSATSGLSFYRFDALLCRAAGLQTAISPVKLIVEMINQLLWAVLCRLIAPIASFRPLALLLHLHLLGWAPRGHTFWGHLTRSCLPIHDLLSLEVILPPTLSLSLFSIKCNLYCFFETFIAFYSLFLRWLRHWQTLKKFRAIILGFYLSTCFSLLQNGAILPLKSNLRCFFL